jgi:hypothetical protein
MVNGITLSTPHCISIVATFIYKRLLIVTTGGVKTRVMLAAARIST